jgi:tungstate transport system permease protein
MWDIGGAFQLAMRLIASGDEKLWGIVALSLEVSLSSAILACVIGLPAGAYFAIHGFRGRRAVVVVFNTLLALPSVVVGLVVYLLLSRAGPLGSWGILFTPTAIVIAQTILVLPIVIALARQSVDDAWQEYRELFHSLSVPLAHTVGTLLWDLRYSLLTVVLAAFGRAASEVGAVMIVGGNIDGVTRVMTTAIALETSKGDLALALALGIVLLLVVLALNAAAFALREWSAKRHG